MRFGAGAGSSNGRAPITFRDVYETGLNWGGNYFISERVQGRRKRILRFEMGAGEKSGRSGKGEGEGKVVRGAGVGRGKGFLGEG